MRVEDAAAAVGYLTSMTTGWNDDSTEQLVYELERLDDPAALMAAVTSLARSWNHAYRPSLGTILDTYEYEVRRVERAAEAAEAARDDSVRCDGTGWLEADPPLPCPTCSPAIFRVWNLPDAKRRWRHGVPLHVVLDYESRSTMLADLSRPPCPPVEIYPDEKIDRGEGVAAALAAYRDAYGREPENTSWLAVIARRPQS